MTDLRPRPTEFPLTMPNQPLQSRIARVRAGTTSHVWRKLFVLGASVLLTLWTTREMYEVLAVSGMTLLEWVLLCLRERNHWLCLCRDAEACGALG